jgi:hypothetical protein
VKERPRYALAYAAVERLLGETAPQRAPAPAEPPAPFSIGAAIFRPPPAVATPALDPQAEQADDEDGAPATTDELLGELVDMVLVGDPEGGAKHEVHLVFKAEVLGGLHMKLEKRPTGLFATFLVDDASSRRMVEGRVDELLVRLRDKGFQVAGHAVTVR